MSGHNGKKADHMLEGHNLRELRKRAKVTLEALSERVGISVSQLSRFETGQRRPRADELRRISLALQAPMSEIMQISQPRYVNVVGCVGAGNEAQFYEEQQHLETVEAPEGSTDNTVAVEIRGDSLGPFFNGWHIFYDEIRTPPTDDILNRLCVVGLDDGRILVKKVVKGSEPGTFTLVSQFETPIFNVRVEWAARVKSMACP